MEQYPDAASEIKAWVGIVEAVRWHNLSEVSSRFRDADYVNGYVMFNIRRNRYRLITVIHYAKTTGEKQTEVHVYIRSFLHTSSTTTPAIGIKGSVQNEHGPCKPSGNDRARRSPRHP